METNILPLFRCILVFLTLHAINHHRFTRIFDNSSELGGKTGKCAREDKEVSVLESKLGELYLATEL